MTWKRYDIKERKGQVCHHIWEVSAGTKMGMCDCGKCGAEVRLHLAINEMLGQLQEGLEELEKRCAKS